MIKTQEIKKIESVFNLLELAGIVLVLTTAFILQIVLHELPCPLCLLQRIGFIGIAFGFILNLRFGLRPSHYAVALLSALFTSFVALRQIALHVVPGSGVYGSAIFGFHLYTWSFIVSMIIIVVTTLMLSIDRQYQFVTPKKMRLPKLTHLLFFMTVGLIVANLVSVFLECGLKACPDDPVKYHWVTIEESFIV
jgi:disulfide bond formation protein DsbB